MMTKKLFFKTMAVAVVLSIATFSASAVDYLVPEFALWYRATYTDKVDTVAVPNLEFRTEVLDYNVTIPYETDSLILKLAWKKLDLSTGKLTYKEGGVESGDLSPTITVVDEAANKEYKGFREGVYYQQEYWVPYPTGMKTFTGHVEVKFPAGFPGYYSGKTLKYQVTITRDDIRSVTTLRYLEVWRFAKNKRTTEDGILLKRFQKEGHDFPQLSSADGPFAVTAEAENDTFQIRLVTSKGKVDSVSYKAPGVNKGKDTLAFIGHQTSDERWTVDSLVAGDVIDITVWAENRRNHETYRVILNAAPDKAAPDGKPLRTEGYVSAIWLEDKVDGRDTVFSLSPNFTGLLTKGSIYTAAVPDPSSPNLKVKFLANNSADPTKLIKDSTLLISKVVDQEDASKFSFLVKLTGPNKGGDSTVTINLLSSETRLADLRLRLESASGTPLVLKPTFHPDITEYEVTSLLPYNAVTLHLFAAARDAGATVSYITGDTLAGNIEFTNDTVNSRVSVYDNPIFGRSAEWQIAVKSVSGDSKPYKVKFRKAFNLNAKKIEVTYDGKPLDIVGIGQTAVGETDLAKKFEYDVLVDTSIPLSKYEEINVAFEIVDKSKGGGLVQTKFLEKEAGKWTQVLRLTPDVGEGREYRVNLLTPSADADLKYLYVEPGFSHLLDPAFSPSVTEYQLRLPAGTTELSFVAVAAKDARDIDGDGEQSFEAPDKTFMITVTAQNGTEKEYTIHAFEEGSGLKAISATFTSAVAKAGVLTLTTPQKETVYVHAADGRAVSVFDKPAGTVSVPLSIANGTVVLRGSSGWVAKTLVR